jgi:hypothetical protein
MASAVYNPLRSPKLRSNTNSVGYCSTSSITIFSNHASSAAPNQLPTMILIVGCDQKPGRDKRPRQLHLHPDALMTRKNECPTEHRTASPCHAGEEPSAFGGFKVPWICVRAAGSETFDSVEPLSHIRCTPLANLGSLPVAHRACLAY